MNALQAFAAGLARSHALDPAVEHITIEPPVWCSGGCGRMRPTGSAGWTIGPVDATCPECAGRVERRNAGDRALRRLVESARLLARQAEDSADVYDDRGCHEAARVIRDLAEATNRAIEGLRQ